MSVAHKLDNLAVLEPRVQTVRPPLYKAVLLNDDYTPMEFVATVVRKVFGKTKEEANRIVLEVHNRGSAVCGVYTRDVAETKADLVMEYARMEEHPLQCVVNKD